MGERDVAAPSRPSEALLESRFAFSRENLVSMLWKCGLVEIPHSARSATTLLQRRRSAAR